MDPQTLDRLIATARDAAARAHAPASKFRVGAAILAKDGSIHPGCNVENASYGLTICAERNAACRAVCDGSTGFDAVAIYTDLDEPARPCGACRQFLAEFNTDMAVILVGRSGAPVHTTLRELLPDPFTFASFEEDS